MTDEGVEATAEADTPDTQARARVRRTPTPEIIKALRNAGGIVSAAAGQLHVTRQTLHEWLSEDPELKAVHASVKEELKDFAEGRLYQFMKEGSEKSVHFFLRTQGRDRGYGDKTTVTGEDGGPISIVITPDDALL